MNEQINPLEQIPYFIIEGGQLFQLVETQLKIAYNELSPFWKQPQGVEEVTQDTMALGEDSDFKKVLEILCQPTLRLKNSQAGPAMPIRHFSTYFKKIGDDWEGAALLNDADRLFVLYFKNSKLFANYFKGQFAQPIIPSNINVLSERQPLEVMIAILNMADCYKRAYLSNMMAYNTNPIDSLYEDEYLAVLEKSLSSGDVRWLVPSFLRLIPNLKNIVLELAPEHLETLKRLQFFTQVEAQPRNLYSLHSAAKYLGLEMTQFYKYAMGMEWADSQGTLEHDFMIVTEEANHWITLNQVADKVTCDHQVYSGEDVEEKVLGYLKNIKVADAVKKSEATSTVTDQAVKNFCPACGGKLNKEAVFCSSCGHKIG